MDWDSIVPISRDAKTYRTFSGQKVRDEIANAVTLCVGVMAKQDEDVSIY